MIMEINLMCSDRNLPNDLFDQHREDIWGGIDRGALILLKHQIIAEFSVGDFDSVNDEERHILSQQLNIHPVKAEKDDTDLGLGVAQAVAEGYKEINIYGATGGRLDHFMGVIQLLLKPEYINKGVKFKIIDTQNEITLLTPGCYTVDFNSNYPYISFIPMSGEPVISLTGFKYELQQEKLEVGSTLTISNEVKHERGNIEISHGHVLQMRSKDKDY